jgi:hypothetical protein
LVGSLNNVPYLCAWYMGLRKPRVLTVICEWGYLFPSFFVFVFCKFWVLLGNSLFTSHKPVSSEGHFSWRHLPKTGRKNGSFFSRPERQCEVWKHWTVESIKLGLKNYCCVLWTCKFP